MSHAIRKPSLYICQNKSADQLCSNCAADQCLCSCYIDRTIHLLILIRNFKPIVSFYDCTALFVLDMVRNTKDRLFCDVAQIMANHSITYFETDILLKDIEL